MREQVLANATTSATFARASISTTSRTVSSQRLCMVALKTVCSLISGRNVGPLAFRACTRCSLQRILSEPLLEAGIGLFPSRNVFREGTRRLRLAQPLRQAKTFVERRARSKIFLSLLVYFERQGAVDVLAGRTVHEINTAKDRACVASEQPRMGVCTREYLMTRTSQGISRKYFLLGTCPPSGRT